MITLDEKITQIIEAEKKELRAEIIGYENIITKGKVEGGPCIVNRDTGCQCIVVQESLLPLSCMLPVNQRVALINRAIEEYPIAQVKIESPFFTGIVRAVVIKLPIFPCIIGNIRGARKLQFLQESVEKVELTQDAATDGGAGRESPPASGWNPVDGTLPSPMPVAQTDALERQAEPVGDRSTKELAGDQGVEAVIRTSSTTLHSEATDASTIGSERVFIRKGLG